MAKYLLLKHYRGAPKPVNDVPMDQWSPAEVTAHIQFMRRCATNLHRSAAHPPAGRDRALVQQEQPETVSRLMLKSTG